MRQILTKVNKTVRKLDEFLPQMPSFHIRTKMGSHSKFSKGWKKWEEVVVCQISMRS